VNRRLAFLHSNLDAARKTAARLRTVHGEYTPEQADVIMVLGGDGFMLRALHQYSHLRKPFYGMKQGTVGFLLNQYDEEDLQTRLEHAEAVTLHPLSMTAVDVHGKQHKAQAINEVSLWRQSNQAAHLRIKVNDVVRVTQLVADGILLSTAAGSTAYNLSVRGPILPLGTDALALTPISPFRPRRWNGAILPGLARVEVEVLDAEKRPVSATADAHEVRDVHSVSMRLTTTTEYTLLFDPDHSLEERILQEQFL
jgi:NAD+ kinase